LRRLRPQLLPEADAERKLMTSHFDYARRYIERFGMALVPIPPGHKAPLHTGWNRPGGFVETVEDAAQVWGNGMADHGIGAVLEPSKLCSLDIGNPERYRIMFRAPEGVVLKRQWLAWHGEDEFTVFELRGGAVQDVLPPTVHPETQAPYVWATPRVI
jgi:putative DNA primase/helicase